jgi:hypothetical protein
MRKADIMNTATRSNILVRAARRIAAATSEVNYAQERILDNRVHSTGK